MARSRDYSVTKTGLTVAAVMDLLAIYAGSGAPFELQGIVISPVNRTTLESLQFSVKRMRATVTSGSAGTSVTPRKILGGDAAATATARAGDTTQATTSGTAEVLHADGYNEVNGAQFIWWEKKQPTFNVNEVCVLSLDSAPAVSILVNVTAYFGETF